MTKIAPTDEMVDRALKKAQRHAGKDINWRDMADILEAAINIPQEPEIEVTEAMQNAGESCVMASYWGRQSPDWYKTAAINAYRAMFRARPKECEHIPIKMTYQWGEHGKPSTQYETHAQHCMKCGAKLV